MKRPLLIHLLGYFFIGMYCIFIMFHSSIVLGFGFLIFAALSVGFRLWRTHNNYWLIARTMTITFTNEGISCNLETPEELTVLWSNAVIEYAPDKDIYVYEFKKNSYELYQSKKGKFTIPFEVERYDELVQLIEKHKGHH